MFILEVSIVTIGSDTSLGRGAIAGEARQHLDHNYAPHAAARHIAAAQRTGSVCLSPTQPPPTCIKLSLYLPHFNLLTREVQKPIIM